MEFVLTFHQPAEVFEVNDDPVRGVVPMQAWKLYMEAMVAAGVLRGANRLEQFAPTAVRVRGGKRQVQDGPFADTKDLLGGYAVVDVNMRGTGCSGGSYDFFEPLQNLDGYDVIETVARQSWALHHKVGMIGISYGGFSQLFVAATDPPHLAAIAPLSVFDDVATLAYPGGILNTGFALSWVKERVHDAKPASATGGQSWALTRIQGGDLTCQRNQT
ncbi:MAG: CocE/NonD family hydrolase, partial [Pseudomonadota bacterium]|nr:CocE/NonD family hydrolase [Pseudomonadota bacterium]